MWLVEALTFGYSLPHVKRERQEKSLAKEFDKRENMTVGPGTLYNGSCVIKGLGPISIGAYCAIGDNLRIVAGNNHQTKLAAMQISFYRSHFGGKYPGDMPSRGVTIGSDVWIGDNCTFLDGAHVGNGCVVAAGAVVKGQFEDYSIIGGVPAKVIKKRFANDVSALLSSLAWWSWDKDRVKRNKAFFYQDLSVLSADDILKLVVA